MINHEQASKTFYKRSVLEELLEIVNDICSKHDLSYFAMSKLLGCVVENRDPEPDDFFFCIGMMRKDYDIFFTKIGEIAKQKKISVVPFYDEDLVITKIHSKIRIKRIFQEKSGEKIEIDLDLRVDPFEFLPDDQIEKNHFLKEVARLTKEYRARSKGQIESKEVKPEKGFLKKIKYNRKQKKIEQEFEKFHKVYRKYIHQYAGKADCSCVGRVELLTYAEHKADTILPYGQKSYGKVKVMIPAKVEEFVIYSSKKAAQINVARKIELLRKFDVMCEKEEIPYFLMHKTASLGITLEEDSMEWDKTAMRVGMMRSDYDKVISLLKNGQTHGIYLNETVEDYLFIKDYRNKASLTMAGKKFPGSRETLLYLYPFDKVPQDKAVFRKLQAELTKAYEAFEKIIVAEKGLSTGKKSLEITSWEYYEQIEKIRQRYNETAEDSYYIYTYDKGRFISLVRAQVYPIVRKSYGSGMACYPAKDFLWGNKKDATYCSYGQDRVLDILRRVSEICDNNAIEYFAVKELLVGAAVYEDFIPDSEFTPLSIGLVREQYEAFLAYMRANDSQYGLKLCEYYEDGDSIPLPLKCIVDEQDCYPSTLRVDLYPFDRISDDFYCQKGFEEDIIKNNEDYRKLVNYYTSVKKNYIANYTDKDYAIQEPIWREQNPVEEYARIDAFAQSFQRSEHTSYLACVAFRRIRMIREKDLYELKMHRFRDIMVPCPKDYSVWQPMVDDDLNDQVSNIQKKCILVLEEFARVCKELGVGFFICGGTLLGYARNGGYIPWDDDIDVGMLREDYNLFLEKAGDFLKKGFFLQTREADPNIPYLFTKLRMDGTVWWSEFIAGRDFHTGICIDIFPFDYLPDDLKLRDKQVEEATALYRKHLAIAKAQYPVPKNVYEAQNALEERYHKEQEAKRLEAWGKSLADSQQEYLKVATKYNADAEKNGLKTVGSFVVSYTYIDLEDLLPYQEAVFEGVHVFVPKKKEVFLHMQYGDFMALPPKHKRMAHRLLYWSTGERTGGRLKEELEKEHATIY